MAFSRAFQSTILADIRGRALEVALYTDDPGATDTGIEVTGTGYARQSMTLGADSVVADGTEAANDAEITFGQATEDWSSGAIITHLAVRDATTGDQIASAALSTSRVVRTGDSLPFPAGAIVLKVPD